jgi:hypothetical protein
MKKNFAYCKTFKNLKMKNQKLKNALKELTSKNALTIQKDLEFLDNKKADQIRGGIGTAPLSSSADSCKSVFSCGLYHVV